MISEILQIIKDQLSRHLNVVSGETDKVILENVAKISRTSNTNVEDKVIITLLMVTEESNLRNAANPSYPAQAKEQADISINLNIFFLIAANRNSYADSLTDLSLILEFFKSRPFFNQINSAPDPANSSLSSLEEFSFYVQLETTNSEQWKNIWEILGGNSIPALLFGVRKIKMKKV